MLSARGKGKEAEAALRRSLALYEDIIAQDKHDLGPNTKLELAHAHVRLGRCLAQNSESKQWVQHLEKAQQAMEGVQHDETLWPSLGAELAWTLVTCPQLECRNIPQAIELTESVNSRRDHQPPLRAALGVARYRSGDLKSATTELQCAVGDGYFS